uniref:Complement component 3-1 n=1 Tax=Hasarius adansoni TaxID=243517 RepID=G1UIC5_9ARAC|nr:complement component 3-1 [Hasarius adansoni]
MDMWSCAVFLLVVGVFGHTCAQQIYVVAPNTLRLNSDETIAVAIDGNIGAVVSVFVQDHPGKVKNISQTLVAVQPGQPELFKIQLNSQNFPPNFLSGPGFPKYVSLTAVFPDFRKELIIPVSNQSGYIFIQTDKPIYTPKERASIRIIPLNEDSRPSEERFLLQIRNPKNIIVEEKYFNDKNRKLDKAFASHVYRFPTYPVLGEWSATVRYGHDLEQNATVRFELEEYVLPTFTVELKVPDVVLPKDETIQIEVKANYVYGKKVKGIVTFRLGVKGDHSPDAVFFAVITPKELDDGSYVLRIKTDDLRRHKDIGWFPEIEGSHLVVEATVADAATGNKETTIDSKGRFSKTPFLISFKRCLKDFKPGLTSVFEADVTYVDGSPAGGVRTKIQAVADNGKKLFIAVSSAQSDENGKVSFEIQPELHHKSVTITLETDDPRYEGSQAKGIFEQHAYQSGQDAYIAIARSSPQKLKPGHMYGKEIHFHPAGIQDIYYMVTARGKILSMNKLPSGAYKNQRVEFQIGHDMVPSFRVVVFAHHKDELIADSLKIDVERECNPEVQVAVTPEFGEKEPGNNGKIVIRGTKGTYVGLLGVDEAVYALSKKDILTKAKVFNKLATHDLGCGPGGGITVNSVLGNAGVTIGTRVFSPTESHSCVEIKRRKREAAMDIVKTYMGTDRYCCSLGLSEDKYRRTCQERSNVVQKYLDGEYPTCAKAFMECCIYGLRNGLADMKVMRQGIALGRMGGENLEEPEFIDAEFEEDFEKQLTVRKDFRETWIYEDVTIGPDNREELGVSLPHSITTWVLQAVSVSPTHGICVAEPQKLVSFKKIFLHLNLPYSVVRNEQVEIQATVFNYGNTKIGAVVYMYGAKDLCSGTQAGEKSERKRLIIEGQSAATVTFPVIPLKAEDFVIKVVALTPAGSDVVQRTLHVVAEGVTKEIDIPIKLDPTNQQRRQKRHIETELYSDHIDPTQNLQVTAVKLSAPEGFVPGTASCSITALGDMYGPAVQTSINNPDALFQKPRGCGEQNMMYLAPTLYALRYLKVTGKLTAAAEESGYEFIRHGYGNQLAFRKEDGSYAAYQSKPTSTWLTAFVIKVFCQATELIHIDDDVVCSGVKWLIKNQERDGSYVEKHPMYHVDMMGGVQGKTPMTAFALIALEECKCDEEHLLLSKKRAVAYLENHLGEVHTPLAVAVVAYALSLSDSELRQVANDKLLKLAKYDEDTNRMYWNTENSAQDIETAGYALLNQLLFNDMSRSNSIVNWLNTKQLQSGSFKSTQDTVVALQAMSEYAIRAQMPSINLVANISSSNDRNFHKVMAFRDDNALVLQDVRIDKIGGTVFINTAGHGMGSLSVKLRYNLNVPVEDICKFDVKVNVTESKPEQQEKDPWDEVLNQKGKDMFERFPEDLIRGIKKELDEVPPELAIDPRRRGHVRASLIASPLIKKDRQKRQKPNENSKVKLNITICVRYLGNKDTEMSIVDAGIFSGFQPVEDDLIWLQDDHSHLIQRYEKSSRGVVFYLQKVPIAGDYCFSFHVVRQYIVGNTQTSVIKVYDYYNPDATCTKFYSPGSNSPMLRTICEGGICECAEGGCPPNNPFSEISSMSTAQRREELKTIFCENYDYVWKGKLNGRLQKDGGFLNISFTIADVIKAGIEKAEDIVDETRTLLARDNCPTANLFPGVTYLILGKDGQNYMNENGETWYRYLLDKTSVIHMWTSAKEAKNKNLQRDLNSVTKALKENGCEL